MPVIPQTRRDWVTGIVSVIWYPYLWAVDLQKGYDMASVNTEIIQRLALLGKNVVVNTSLGLPCNGTFADRSCIEPAALSWIEKVRGSALFATGHDRAGEPGEHLHPPDCSGQRQG